MNTRLGASLMVCFAFMLWGATSLFVRFIEAGPYTFVLANAICGWFTLLPLFIARKGYREIASPKKLAVTIGVGFLQTIMGVLYIQSLQLTTITNGLLAFYTMPMFVILLSPLILRERRSLTTILALPVAFAGLAIMLPMQDLSLANTDVLGIAYGVTSALFYALSMIGIRKLGGTYSSLTIVMMSFTASIIALSPVILAQPAEMQAMKDFAFLLVIRGVFTNAFPWLVLAWCLKTVEAQHVSIMGYLEPLVAIALAAVVVGEIPGVNTFIGGILILGTGIWIIIKGSRHEAELATDKGIV